MARVYGYFVVQSPDDGVGAAILSTGTRSVLADVADTSDSAIELVRRTGSRLSIESIRYVIMMRGRPAHAISAKEQAMLAMELLNRENASSMMTRVTEMWPNLCDNEYDWYSCNPSPWKFKWMSPPELSLSVVSVSEHQGCEVQDGWLDVTAVDQRPANPHNDTTWASELRQNVSRLGQDWLEVIPTCYGAKNVWNGWSF